MNEKLLSLLNEDARYTAEELATMLGEPVEQVRSQIAELERIGIIRGYKTLIDWASVDDVHVTAIIELKIVPQADAGFEEIAERISQFEHVESVYLMSGGYDLSVMVKGKTFQEVALFVAKELSTIDSVISTATHFVLRRYKELDVELINTDRDDRGNFSLC